ncbi:MAG: DUF5658 family protein [Planctomycetota bacterium]|jgi:hypothetical protein
MLNAISPGSMATDDRRDRVERRSRPTPLLSRYHFFGRRKGGRRNTETRNQYVDRYTTREWALTGAIFALSMLDLVFTLIHLDAGGREANPVMDWFLQWGGTDAFTLAKCSFTVVGLLVLLVHVRFDRVRNLMRFALLLYSALFIFHLYVMYVRVA